MFKKVTLLFLVLLFVTTMAVAQTVTLEPYGRSPRDVSKDPTDIFNRAYNGLLNVGVQTQMYLKGTMVGGKLTSPTWTVTQAPTGSAATITTTVMIDTATQVAVFTPDVVGTFKIQFADGDKSATVTINSATYVGAFAGDGNCVLCHSSKAAEWEQTGHYSLFERAMNGDPAVAGHYSESCISCHVTGYDTSAVNNGFDDRPFVFPDSLYPGQYDSLLKKFPDAMKLARIQCESCHGPGFAHNGDISDSKMVSALSSDNCAWCHDSGTHHVYPEQWDVSRHANPLYAERGSEASCAPCHSGAGFVAWVKGGKASLTEVPEVTAITCATCHEPHSDANEHQVRTVEVTLENGEQVTGGGLGKLCMNCHKSRRNAAVYTGPNFSYSSHYGPHHGPQAEMLIGTNVPTFGKKLPSSAHFAALENACVTCHMAEGHADESGNIILAGSHSFSMTTPDGVDNVKACEECHGDIGESFGEKKFYMNGVADHDGDGVEEGLADEVEGLLEKLAMMLPPLDTAEVDIGGDYIYTQTDAKAAYNWFFVEEDRSHGVHNPAFAVSLLKVSIQAVMNHTIEGGIVEVADVPNDQGKHVRIVWNKFADDGVAVDPIASYTIKRDDGDETWTGVGQHLADGSARYALVVPTVYDSTTEGDYMTKFKVVAISRSGIAFESEPAEGHSIDNLVPHTPGNFMALLAAGNVDLSWEAPVDPDINYYKIYRGTDVGFTPDESNMVGTTADLFFTDKPSELGTYYYVAAAVDFSGNLGEFTSPVSATLTSVDKDGAVPLNYELSQNYPNPFNPETSIKFGLKNAGHVTLKVYNSTGQIVKNLVDQDMTAGNHNISFLADGLTSGVYIYRIMVTNGDGEQFQAVRKMILMK
jgi:hypothetical protein